MPTRAGFIRSKNKTKKKVGVLLSIEYHTDNQIRRLERTVVHFQKPTNDTLKKKYAVLCIILHI